ncbi:MAG: Ig-like domain-containing protein, partial [Planctomycetes bacterium]|nr:Ig-like domain-containing protein [Planctomycetota bacterium]
MMRLIPITVLSALFALPATNASIARAEDAVVQPAALEMQPPAFALHGHRARQQLQLDGRFTDADVRDLTGGAQFTSSNEAVAVVEGSVVRPVGDGSATITAKIGDREANADVTVTGMQQPSPVSFKNETLAALTKAGCNQGACHGSPSGKAGFRLSLRAFDP